MKCVAKCKDGRPCTRDRILGLKICHFHSGYISFLEEKIHACQEEIKRVRAAE